jgi:hypothetical protein
MGEVHHVAGLKASCKPSCLLSSLRHTPSHTPDTPLTVNTTPHRAFLPPSPTESNSLDPVCPSCALSLSRRPLWAVGPLASLNPDRCARCGSMARRTVLQSTNITVRVAHAFSGEISPTELQARWEVNVQVDGFTEVRLLPHLYALARPSQRGSGWAGCVHTPGRVAIVVPPGAVVRQLLFLTPLPTSCPAGYPSRGAAPLIPR